MSTVTAHQEKITHNHEFVDLLRDSKIEFYDWAVVGLFYTAVHQIERYFAHAINQHFNSHEKRNNAVARFTDVKPIFADYRDLQDMSRDARYDTIAITQRDFADAEVLLGNIETQIDALCP
jgi:hypothetical protein